MHSCTMYDESTCTHACKGMWCILYICILIVQWLMVYIINVANGEHMYVYCGKQQQLQNNN